MKSHGTPPTKGLVAVAHHRLVRLSSLLLEWLNNGFEVFSVRVDEAKYHQACKANWECNGNQEIQCFKDNVRLATSCFGVVLHLYHDGLVSRSRREMQKNSGDGTDPESNPSNLQYPNMRGAGTKQRSTECNGKCQRACGNSNDSINEGNGRSELLLGEFTDFVPCGLCIHDSLAN
jgi:hypothetical protein